MIPAPYVEVIVEGLMNARSGGPNRRLIFNLPAGHMKSLLISILFTAWRLGVNPSERIICASYSDDLAHQLSRLTRQVMQSRLYRKIFPGTVLDKKAQEVADDQGRTTLCDLRHRPHCRLSRRSHHHRRSDAAK